MKQTRTQTLLSGAARKRTLRLCFRLCLSSHPTLLLPAAVSCLLFSFLLTHFYCLPLAQSVWSGHKALSLLIATVGQETPHTNTHTKERERKIIKKRRLREEAGMIFITQNLGRVNVFQCSC